MVSLYIPLWFPGRELGSDCTSSGQFLIFNVIKFKYTMRELSTKHVFIKTKLTGNINSEI